MDATNRFFFLLILVLFSSPPSTKPEKDFSQRFLALETREAGMARGSSKFPTMDAALIGLAFLTFAVCLIDLIKKFITKLQAKKASAMTTTRVMWETPSKPLEELSTLVTSALRGRQTDPDCGKRVLCRAHRLTSSPPPLLMNLLRWILGFSSKEAEIAQKRSSASVRSCENLFPNCLQDIDGEDWT